MNKIIASSRRTTRGVPVTSFESIELQVSPITACTSLTIATYYHDGAGSQPANGDTIYTESPGVNKLNGNDDYYRDANSFSGQVSSVGVVSNVTACP